MASAGFPAVLDQEESAAHRPTAGRRRCPNVDSNDVGSESALGSAADSWRALEARDGHFPSHGREVHGAPEQTTVADLAHVPHQSPSANCAADFLVVPTATCRLLFVLVVLAHERRRIVHIAVTDRPTAAWTSQQLREAFPLDEAPRYLVHDRDTAFHAWATAAPAFGIEEVVTAVRSPWQNAYVERLIGSIRRECLDHIIISNERGLRRALQAYVEYYLRSRTHVSLDKDAPISRLVASPTDGDIVAVPQVGGLHHRYERRAA